MQSMYCDEYIEEEFFDDADTIRFEEFQDHYRRLNKSHCRMIIETVLYGSISNFLGALHLYRHFLMDYSFSASEELACKYEAAQMQIEIESQFERVIEPLEKAIRENNGHAMESLLDVIAIEAGYSLKERQADAKLYENFVLHLIFPLQQINA